MTLALLPVLICSALYLTLPLHAAPAAAKARKAAAQKAAAQPAPPVAPAPPAPAAPVTPHWPANEKPAKAQISWDSHGLRIEAANASLQQILKEVATLTGMQIEGLAGDERVFGSFGPAPARDVLAQLLHGAGYNLLMTGELGPGTPRQLLLSSPNSGGSARMAYKRPGEDDEDDDADDADLPDEVPQPANSAPAMQPGMPPGGMPQPNEDPRQRGLPEGMAPPNQP